MFKKILIANRGEIALRVQRLLDDPDCSTDALTRLIGAVLQAQHEEWSYGERRYFSDISMRKLVHTLHEHTEPARPELYLTA